MPRLRLTAQHVDSLPAVNGRRTDYADAIMPGLVLRVSPSGKRSWAVLFSRGRGRAGRRTARVTIGPTGRWSLQAARAEARSILEAGEAPPAPLSLRALVEQALADLVLAERTRYEWGRLAEHDVYGALGHRPAAELKRGDVRALLKEIGRRSPSVANRVHTLLSRAYRWAIAEELITVSPLEGLGRLFHETERERVLSPDELRRLLGALARMRDGWAQSDVVLLLLLTGVRKSAALGLRRSELSAIDGREPIWTIPAERSKRRRAASGAQRPHLVPLSPQAAAVIKRRIAVVDEAFGADFDCLFPAGGSRAGEDHPPKWTSEFVPELHEEMRAVTEDVLPGPPDPPWTVHSLRHTIATHLVEDLGVSVVVADLVLGHVLPGSRMTRRYIRAELLPERRAALERWADWLERLAEPGRQARVLAGRW